MRYRGNNVWTNKQTTNERTNEQTDECGGWMAHKHNGFIDTVRWSDGDCQMVKT